MRWLKRGVGVALVGAFLVGGWMFAAENGRRVTISYLFGELADVALWQALVGAFAAGALLVAVLAFYRIARLRLVARRYRKEVRGLEAEVHELRNLPLEPGPPVEVDTVPEEAIGRSA